MMKNFIFLLSFCFLALNSSRALAENPQKKTYTYEQTSLSSNVIKKDLRIKAAVFVSENNLKFKDSLFNPPENELLESKTITIDQADIKIDNSQKAPQRKADSQLITGLLSNALRESGKFAIVERQDVNAILREAEFSNSKWVNPEQANKIGTISGVKFIVIANLLKSEAGERVGTNNYVLAIRLTQVETGDIFATGQGDGATIKDAVTSAVKSLCAKIDSQPWSTRIIKIENDFIYLAAGSDEGLKKKDVLEVYKINNKIIDPLTNKILGTDQSKVGKIEIIEILGTDLSKAKILDSTETFNLDFIAQATATTNTGTNELSKWKQIHQNTITTETKTQDLEDSSAISQTTNMSMPIEGLVQIANPAIVMITTVSNSGGGLGSGFLINSDGIIVTNYHVIKDAQGLGVKFAQDKELITNVSVIKTDALRDIALLKIGTAVNVTPLAMGDSNQIVVGERVVAIGNPKGLSNTVSDGLISAVRDTNGIKQIQISVPISPGSSGGALINMRGEVIGITTSGYDGAQNLNFAIPINYVKEYL